LVMTRHTLPRVPKSRKKRRARKRAA
jgi:hypothetical protein